VRPATDFTIQEQARLLRLRQRIREARAGGGRLYDDLAPELSQARATVISPIGALVNGSSGGRRWPVSRLVLAASVVPAGCRHRGNWRTAAAMDAIEPSGETSLVDRYVPGPLASPGKYFAAVNSASGRGVLVQSAALLDQKGAMDRWEAVLFVGVAICLASLTQRTDDSPSTGFDFVAVCLLVALRLAVCPSSNYPDRTDRPRPWPPALS
jgi:hypothetical protein